MSPTKAKTKPAGLPAKRAGKFAMAPLKRPVKLAKEPTKASALKDQTQAVIRTGGKQYLVRVGQKLRVEKLALEVGKEAIFEQVLMLINGHDIELGNPLIAKAKVTAKVLAHGKADKVMIFKFKPKKRSKKKKGHRQLYTEVEIIKIG